MKPWIKLEYSLLKDARMVRLVDELGTKGLGVYAIVRLLVECRNGGVISMPELLQAGSEYTSRRIISRVVNDYDLFSVDDEGHVCVRVRASVREDARASVREGEPIISKEKENRELEGEKVLTTSTTDLSSPQGAISKVRQWMTNDNNLIWREPMMMHSGYGILLQRHWTEAVEFFIQHMLAQDKLGDMYNEHEARQYFTNFSKIGVGSGKALMEHLSKLNDNPSTSSGQAHNDNCSAENDGRPPKPSPTAQWSYATEEWVEVH